MLREGCEREEEVEDLGVSLVRRDWRGGLADEGVGGVGREGGVFTADE